MTFAGDRDAGDEAVTVLGADHRIRLRHAAYTVVETLTVPGGGLPPHALDSQDQAVYVLSGEFRLATSDEQCTLGAGATAVIPRGAVHALTACGPEPARCLVILTPPDGPMEALLDRLRGGTTRPSSAADVVYATARQVGIALLTEPV